MAFNIVFKVTIELNILFKSCTEILDKMEGNISSKYTNLVTSAGNSEESFAVSWPRKSVNAEIAKDGMVQTTFGTWFSILIIKSRMIDSGIFVSFCVVKICVSISTKTLLDILRIIPEDEFIIVNMFRI